jgi:diguanylate cyclase (GGDEF)-like protein/PAS domain S-box-containing protein
MRDEQKTKEQLINELKVLRQQISEVKGSEQHYRCVIEDVADVIYTLSPSGAIMSLNPAFEKITGLSHVDWIGNNFAQIIHPADLSTAMENFQYALSGVAQSKFELRILTKSGEYLVGEFTATPQIQDGRVVRVLGIARDITEQKKMEEKLRALSLTDELTGLYNRRGFFALVDHLLKSVKRRNTRVLMLYADLDNMKGINDSLGHQVGDKALVYTANLLKATYRESDIIARIGGDEFVVVPVGTNGDTIEVITARLQKNIDTYNAKSSRRFRISMSLGVSCYDPKFPCSIDEMLAQGDKAMYEEKKLK